VRKRLEVLCYTVVLSFLVISLLMLTTRIMTPTNLTFIPHGEKQNDASQEKEKSGQPGSHVDTESSTDPAGDRTVVYPGE
jgi:hypothetical protein